MHRMRTKFLLNQISTAVLLAALSTPALTKRICGSRGLGVRLMMRASSATAPLATSAHFVWPRETLRLGEKYPLKAGLVTSLGFGHVSGLIALVHPQAFLAALDPEQRADYQARANRRILAGQRRLLSAIAASMTNATRNCS